MSIIFVISICALLIITGLKKRPGIGIIIAMILIAIKLWVEGSNLYSLGFGFPTHWGKSLLLGLLSALVIFFLSDLLFEPLIEKLTKTSPNYGNFKHIKRNWIAFIQIIIFVWIFVAVAEEGLYRGFLMNEIVKISGSSTLAIIFNILLTSIVFGLSHGYQNRSGIWITGVIGILFGLIFFLSNFNLWIAVFAHGFLDTFSLFLFAINKEHYFRNKLWCISKH